jgi:sugar lactone lactonase YvrE
MRKTISRENAMRKFAAVLFIVACMTYMAACGGSSSTTTTAPIYDLPTPVAKPASRTILGGAVQGIKAIDKEIVNISPIAGSTAGFSNFSAAGSVAFASSAAFRSPISVTTDGQNLYVADYVNNAIRQINIETKRVKTIAGNEFGLAGSADGKGTVATFNRPSGITTDDGTNLYVTDSFNYTIRKIVISTREVTTVAGGVGVAGSVDAKGVVDAAGVKTGGPNTNARFNILNGITTDGTSLYVTDSNNTIRRIVINTWDVSTLAGAPGTSGSADGPPASARFNVPARLATDGPNLYVTDSANSTIRQITLATGAVTTIAGKVGPSGAAGSHANSTDGTGLTARFNQPNGITTDGANLYVTDSYDNAVRKIVLATSTASGPVSTLLTNGTANVNTTVGITTGDNCLFITDFTNDTSNHGIRKIQ